MHLSTVLISAIAISHSAAAPLALMPTPEDRGAMWWAEGVPTVVKGAPWHRVIETGRYAFVLDTETLAVPHFGTVSEKESWRNLPPAELALEIKLEERVYRCTEAKPWTRFTGPRLIEAGRFFQRGDVTDLIFKADDGEELEVAARFETAAWPDRLGLVLIAETGGALAIRLEQGGKTLAAQSAGGKVALAIDPLAFAKLEPSCPIKVAAAGRPVEFDPGPGWHRINLDGIEPVRGGTNDAMERVTFTLQNTTDREQVARLMFEKTRRGIRQRIGSPITGVSAVLRDAAGNPLGIPVQLSKNWHNKPEGGTYAEQWFHGITLVRLPPHALAPLELVIVYGHWGGIAAASHAQLSLIGWGGNQLWEQSALGAWGESICFDPEQGQAACSITDVRPLMVTPKNGKGKWSWTNNVGGGDFFRLFDPKGTRVPHSAMRAEYHRYGPCLTEVTYSGRAGAGIRHSETVSLARTDDIVRGTFRIRMDMDKAQPFSRFVIFQIGADTYNFTREAKFAVGNGSGLVQEWPTKPGGGAYKTEPIEASGAIPWVSMHEGKPRPGSDGERGAWANRGLIIREWDARLGGKPAKPLVAERGTTRHRSDYSTIDLVPPPGVTRLVPGDFVEATLEYLVIPQRAGDYYRPNQRLRNGLRKHAGTWEMVHWEAVGNARKVELSTGKLVHTHPDVRVVVAQGDRAAFTLRGGLGYVPITVTGLKQHAGYTLSVDGKPLDQSVHGNDFWQTDYDSATKRFSRTYNFPTKPGATHAIELRRSP